MSTFDPELLELMPDVVLLYRKGDPDTAGNDTWAETPVSTPANITVQFLMGEPEQGQGQAGFDTPVKGTIIVPWLDIQPRDKIEFLGITKFVENVESFRDAPDAGYYVQQITYKDRT